MLKPGTDVVTAELLMVLEMRNQQQLFLLSYSLCSSIDSLSLVTLGRAGLPTTTAHSVSCTELTYYLQLGQLPDVSGQELKVVVTQVESTKSGCKISIPVSLRVCGSSLINNTASQTGQNQSTQTFCCLARQQTMRQLCEGAVKKQLG